MIIIYLLTIEGMYINISQKKKIVCVCDMGHNTANNFLCVRGDLVPLVN